MRIVGLLCLFVVVCVGCRKTALEPDWVSPLENRLEGLADSLTTHLRPWQVPDRIFRVEDYGAKGDGVTLNTLMIQAAIDDCSAEGGGVVLFSGGDYVTGTIDLKSGVMLEVAEDSRILGSTNIKDYPDRIESFKSVMSENHLFRQSLIYAENASRIGIRGKGEIYFRGEKENFSSPQTVGPIKDRPMGIRMVTCDRVVLKDILLRNAASWMQNYIACKDLIFDGIRVHNQANFNNDGLDPDGCKNVIVRNCVINSEDDAMCLKGGSGLPSENILIENSVFVTTCNAFKLGTDTQGDFRNIIMRHVKLGGVPDSMFSVAGNEASTGITLATVDGAAVENILLRDLEIDQARCPIFLRIGDRGRALPGQKQPAPGRLRHIVISDVEGDRNLRQGSFISGINGHRVKDIYLRNICLTMSGGGTRMMVKQEVPENEAGYPDAHQFNVNGLPAYGFFVRHAENVVFDRVKVIPIEQDERPDIYCGGDNVNVVYNLQKK